jgi:hypothetical protein
MFPLHCYTKVLVPNRNRNVQILMVKEAHALNALTLKYQVQKR